MKIRVGFWRKLPLWLRLRILLALVAKQTRKEMVKYD